jgi:GNAT superfamily N-acetyltransferase
MSQIPSQHAQNVTVPLGEGALEVGPVAAHESDELFAIFSEVVASGDGFPHRPPLSRHDFAETWERGVTMVVGARLVDESGSGDDGGAHDDDRARSPSRLVGAYYLKPNFVGRASHIANAGYIVERSHRRQGIGRALVSDSLWRAPLLGFDAIEFNLVFASNPARALYEELGWVEIGRLPDAVDGEEAVIYWRQVSRSLR